MQSDEPAQVLRSASGYAAEREPGTLRELGELEEVRIAPDERVTRAKGDAALSPTDFAGDHWIYDAGIEIFFDADGDGYYRYLRVTFDVDSYFDPAWVFARLYLSADGETWELYHETEDFRVDGARPGDEYEVETELVASYPPGQYDLLIEIYDADTGVFTDELGPAQSSALALLPLEDRSFDVDPPPVVVTHEGGGGSVSWPLLAVLALAAAAVRLRHGGGRAPAVARRSRDDVTAPFRPRTVSGAARRGSRRGA